jgi:hypothetical protein
MFKTETTPDGTRVFRQVPGNYDHVGRGEMPEATKQLLQDLIGEAEDGVADKTNTGPERNGDGAQ